MPEDQSSPESVTALAYDEVIDCDGIAVPFVHGLITPRIEGPLRSGRYERGERRQLEALLGPDDRVLDLGAGLGLVAVAAARRLDNGAVLSVEAQPDLLPVIRETWALNAVVGAEIRHGVVAAEDGPPANFFVRDDFWASSFEADSRPYRQVVEVPRVALADLIAEFRPTVISCDIEGAERGLFDNVDLSGVRAMVLETHPKVYGEAARDELIADLAESGLIARPQDRPSTVHVLERGAKPASAPALKTGTDWPPASPRVLLATCMKDEGPFILEWLAWHKAVGITDFVVFTNDCTDGTDRLLDRLDELGEVVHLPNPATSTGSSFFQPAALEFVQAMPLFRRADFFLSMDVDEFLDIHVGNGSIGALLSSVEPFDVLSVCELNHGANGHHDYRRGWVTELFPAHATPNPGKWRARAGVKSLTRISDRIMRIRNHRPDLAVEMSEAVWLDGSGRRMDDLANDLSQNGIDSRGRRELVSLQHFPLRSLDSFLVKMARGDVVIAGKQASHTYWRRRNRNEFRSHDLSRGIAVARREHARYEADPELMALHEACCAAHEAKIVELRADPVFAERRAQLLAQDEPEG